VRKLLLEQTSAANRKLSAPFAQKSCAGRPPCSYFALFPSVKLNPSTRLTALVVAADVRRLTTAGEEKARASSRRLLQEKDRLVSELRGDLDWIVMKALEKDHARQEQKKSARRCLSGREIVMVPSFRPMTPKLSSVPMAIHM
jgi:hypothetical protein